MAITSKRKRRLSLWPSSTQLRSALAYILITAVALTFLNLYTSNRIRNMLFSAQCQSLSSKAQLLSTALLQLDELNGSRAQSAYEALDDLDATRSVVCDAGGFVLFDSLENSGAAGKLALFPELVTALEHRDAFYCIYHDNAIESRVAMPLMKNGELIGAVYLMRYDTAQGALIAALELNILRISIGLEIAIVLVSLLFSTAFSRRIRKILYSIRMMREGDYSYKLPLRGRDELARLGREFNNLADRLEESEQRRRQFVSDASHEFKTPLASIKLLSDSILQNEMDAQTQQEFITDIGREADRLGRLSQKLLALTRLDSDFEEEREIVDAATTVRKVARMLQPLAELQHIAIRCELESGCYVMTVEDDLYQIVFNLVENAIKYNRENGRVEITLLKTTSDVLLTVEDDGVGIPQDALEHIFERFYRVDKARSRAAGGSGLGLSIVHDMVERNFGSISARQGVQRGSVFTVSFPLFDIEEEKN